MKDSINIGLVGAGFMGKAHSNAWLRVADFFDVPLTPHLHSVCGRDEAEVTAFARRFHWQNEVTSWEQLIDAKDIHAVDICTPNNLHLPVTLAAADAGKHILCEKPMARSTEEAEKMYDAVTRAGVVHMMIFNYRFVPAIRLASQFICEGKIGEIRHFNAVYYQDWLTDPTFPITWRHDAEASGSGAHGDMNAHIVDLARFLVGEFQSVTGARKTFTQERPLRSGKGKGKVTTDDATSFLATFGNGALGSFQATRMAPGRKNYLRLEIFGSLGSLSFNLERLNELNFCPADSHSADRGFRNILVTDPDHPYVNAWWPPGHTLGWEHTFIHQLKEFLQAIGSKKSATPDFYDGLRCQQVLDAVMVSVDKQKWIDIPEYKKA